MGSFDLINLLPFWILGFPLVVALVSLMRLPRRSDLIHADPRREHEPAHR